MKKIIIAIAITLTAASCTVYRPQIVDIPLIEEKGETRIDAAAGFSFWLLPDAISFGATATHGFTDLVSGQVHANYSGNGNYYLQAAPGIHTRVGSSATFEAFAGIGYGASGYESTPSSSSETSSENSSQSHYAYDGTYLLPYAQLNFGWRHLGPCEIAFGLKAGAFIPDYTYQHFDENGDIQPDRTVNYKTTNALLEPQLQFRVGSDRVKYTLRISFAWLDDVMSSNGTNFTYDFFTISNGLTFTF